MKYCTTLNMNLIAPVVDSKSLNHLVIHSTDSFKQLINSETKQVTVFMNESVIHWITWFIQNHVFIQ